MSKISNVGFFIIPTVLFSLLYCLGCVVMFGRAEEALPVIALRPLRPETELAKSLFFA